MSSSECAQFSVCTKILSVTQPGTPPPDQGVGLFASTPTSLWGTAALLNATGFVVWELITFKYGKIQEQLASAFGPAPPFLPVVVGQNHHVRFTHFIVCPPYSLRLFMSQLSTAWYLCLTMVYCLLYEAQGLPTSSLLEGRGYVAAWTARGLPVTTSWYLMRESIRLSFLVLTFNNIFQPPSTGFGKVGKQKVGLQLPQEPQNCSVCLA